MNEDQEQRILTALQQPCSFQWGGETTLYDLQRDLATLFPATLDVRGLEEIGLNGDTMPIAGEKRHERVQPQSSQDPFGDEIIDPFAATPAERQESNPQHAAAADASDITAQPWWRRTNRSGNKRYSVVEPAPLSIGARLLTLLESLDLTVNIHGGQLILTTTENAESALCNRVYDVTPLFSSSQTNYSTLSNTIEISVEPNTWESLGGPSTLALFASPKRQLLVVSAPSTVHWKVQSLLDRLNR